VQIFEHLADGAGLVFGLHIGEARAEIVVGSGWCFDDSARAKLALGRDKVTLSVTSPENGTAAEEIAAEYSASGLEIGFNANYLKDILSQIDGDMVELHLADAGAPTLIRKDDKSPALYVLMPMRV
jgi:DNA polymerase III sliding clamp (beta) subunit (PCNA family)